MDKWICQTFWTRPMNKVLIANNVNIAAISLYYAHRSGYMVKMYTDSYGKKLLSKLGYDMIVTDLDQIPKDIPTKIFAYAKAIALKKEPLGVIHTDFDVFIKKNCLEPFYKHRYDCILQNSENNHKWIDYVKGREFFKKYKFPELYIHMLTANVGVIGFNNAQLKELYLSSYFSYVEYFKDKINDCNFCVDLFFEQVSIDYIVKKNGFNPYYILPPFGSPNIDRIAQKKGYQHLFGGYKNTEDGIKRIQQLKDELYEHKERKTLKVWAAPCTGKTTLCLKDDRHFVDFDLYKTNHGFDIDIDKDFNMHCKVLFKLYQKACKDYENSGKILLISDVVLLGAFYRDFNAIYGLGFETLKKRIKQRDTERDEHNIDVWAGEVTRKLNLIQLNNVREIRFLGKEEYLENRIGELLKIAQ